MASAARHSVSPKHYDVVSYSRNLKMPKAIHYWHRRPNKRNCAMVTSLQMTRKTIASPKGNALASVNNLNFGRTRSTPCMRFPSDYFFARLQTSPLTGTKNRTSIVPWEFFMIQPGTQVELSVGETLIDAPWSLHCSTLFQARDG